MPPDAPCPRPNVVFVIADDHRHDALGTSGHPAVKTPALDALAARGTRFSRAYQMGGLIAAVCSPARAALLTGRHTIAANAAPEASSSPSCIVGIPEDATTLPEAFRKSGYQTFITGKWHNDTKSLHRSFAQGRRIFIGGMSEHTRVPLHNFSPTGDYSGPPHFEPGFSTELFCDAAVNFIRSNRKSDPFFLYLALTSPHDPRTPPAPYEELYQTEHLPLPCDFRPDHPFDNGEMDIRDEILARKPLTPGVTRRHLAAYYGMISHQDAQIGKVLKALKDSGAESNTIVVYVSDHGLAIGSHGLLGKQNLYEPSVRVPLILSGPGIPAGEVNHNLVYSLDLYATLARLAGVDTPGDGISRSLLTEDGRSFAAGRDHIFSMYKDCQRMVSDGCWKLIRYHVNGAERQQLFDLDHDPHELDDRASDPAVRQILGRLAHLLDDWQTKTGDRWMPRGARASS